MAEPRSGDFGGSVFGNVDRGSIEFKRDGRIHHSVLQTGSGRMSWETTPSGLAGDPHFTDQGLSKGAPGRHPFPGPK